MENFNFQDYKKKLNEFPNISYQEYQEIKDEQVRQDIAKKNKILQTDTYNRTMNHIKWSAKSNLVETFTFSMRRAPEWSSYIVVDGIRKMIKNLFSYPITQGELDFAKDFYADQKEKWWVGLPRRIFKYSQFVQIKTRERRKRPAVGDEDGTRNLNLKSST